MADLGCGVGAETVALARAGLRVRAVDADPLTAAMAAANVAALGLADRVAGRVRHAHEECDLSTVDAAFCDPARRTGGGRVFDPRAYSPPWSFVLALVERVPPDRAQAGTRHGPRADPGRRRGRVGVGRRRGGGGGALVRAAGRMPGAGPPCCPGAAPTLTGSGTRARPVGAGGPVPATTRTAAVVRAHLVAEFAATVDGVLADPEIAYVLHRHRRRHPVRPAVPDHRRAAFLAQAAAGACGRGASAG